MGFERNAEDPHKGAGSEPKMSWAGRFDGCIDGRPVSLVMDGRDIKVLAAELGTLVALRRNWQAVRLLGSLLKWANIRVLVRLKWLGYLEVFPSPSPLVRLFLPSA